MSLRVKERLTGLAFIVILLALLGVCVAAYMKVFTPVTWISLETDHTGLQFNEGADVKLHGVLVGEVRTIASQGDGARLKLALDPAMARQIPGDVSARLLPKTLFGEKYVELVPPAAASGTIAPGTVITQDRTSTGVELESVLNNALPLLRALPPDKLSATLSAMATALEGRGEQLGETIVNLGDYVRELNEEMPTIEADLELLAEVLDNYHGALPDLMGVLRNLTVTANTITDQESQLKAFLTTTADFADDTRVFLDRYQGRLIQFGEVTRPVLDLLAAYAPEYPCLFAGLVEIKPAIEDTFATGRLHITLEIVANNGKYEPGRDEPEWLDRRGPDCRGLPNPNVPGAEHPIDNGYDYDGSRVNLPIELPGLTDAESTVTPPAGLPLIEPPGEENPAVFDPTMGYAGTAEEQAVIDPLVAAFTGQNVTDLSDLATLLWGPLLRGTTVNATS
ncbi:MCE family protein [Phytomonospora endophytica]|uniref:Phospholipid/cholesterol/gamma-HCH transport system substrate-binding protein n=1 Tax=Phytomonospora endophytica TaxID=714109 RepID=A0A841FZR5_9ACTN|nr:MCE family protein [Phytomonospora endophytica]MBB6037420.1 phospholipid/cholesterol/gamma-HCH transport system substrate-binding protein [Phytomonospora endophytica]GIG69837.1 ABC transporter substrate-binding protein [Phytomonospora endophytica]